MLVPDSTPITEPAVAAATDAALAAINAAATMTELRAARSGHAGEASPLALLNASLKNVPADERAAAGKLVGSGPGPPPAKRLAVAEEAARLEGEAVDVTAVASRWRKGARHPSACSWRPWATSSWAWAGRSRRARSSRTSGSTSTRSTSTRTTRPAPCRTPSSSTRSTRTCCCARTPARCRSARCSPASCRSTSSRPGKVFRTDELDATHTPVFHQIEGLAIDKGLTMAHLRGTLEHLARADVRRRGADPPAPQLLPVHRAERRAGRLAAERQGRRALGSSGAAAAWSTPTCCAPRASTRTSTQGFAFGMGIERTLMFRNDLDDMRDMVEGDIRFSQQFGMVV